MCRPAIGVQGLKVVDERASRLARSLHFSNADDAEVHRPLRLIEQQMEESGEYGSMAAKMREQLNYYLRMPPKNKTFEPSLLRASFQNPYVEYYNFGMFCFILYKAVPAV